MNLTELQAELYSIEKIISNLHLEIENMKSNSEDEKRVDFEKITKLARKHPIGNKVIGNMSNVDKQLFVNSLSYLILADEEGIYYRLLYLNRLANGCGVECTAEELYMKGLAFDTSDLERLCKELQEYKYTYFVEAFIMANVAATAPSYMLTLIADMALIMECDKEDIRIMALVAKAKLQDNFDILCSISGISANRWNGYFKEYIPQEWIVSQRRECRLICLDKQEKELMYHSFEQCMIDSASKFKTIHPCIVKEILQTGQIVKKGDTLLTYRIEVEDKEEDNECGNISNVAAAAAMFSSWRQVEEKKTRIEIRKIIASHDGIVKFTYVNKTGVDPNKQDLFLGISVISYFDDYEDFDKLYLK